MTDLLFVLVALLAAVASLVLIQRRSEDCPP